MVFSLIVSINVSDPKNVDQPRIHHQHSQANKGNNPKINAIAITLDFELSGQRAMN